MSDLFRLCPERAECFQLKAEVCLLCTTWMGLAVPLAAAAQPFSACRRGNSGKALDWGAS